MISFSHPGSTGSSFDFCPSHSNLYSFRSLRRDPSAHLGPTEEASWSHERNQAKLHPQDNGFPVKIINTLSNNLY